MGPELTVALEAAGAAAAAGLRRRPALAISAGGGLAAAGLLTLLPVPALRSSVVGLDLSPEARALLAAAAASLTIVVAFAPTATARAGVLAGGLAALAALAAAAALPDVAAVAVVAVVIAVAQAMLPGGRPFAERLRGPAFGASLLIAGALLAHAGGGDTAQRLSALTLVLGVVAIAGLVPFLPALDPAERAPASALAWTGFLGPVLAVVLTGRLEPSLAPAAVPVFGAVMVGLGLLNLLWGGVGAWLVEGDVAAWRYSFLAEWGLVLVGLGVVVRDGAAAAYLVLLSILLIRVPLYAWARPVLAGSTAPTRRPAGLVVAAALAGAPPFAGFAARALLLRGAAAVYPPLALVAGLGMLLFMAHGFRLGRTVPIVDGRPAIGVLLALAAAVVLGVVPAVALAMAGF